MVRLSIAFVVLSGACAIEVDFTGTMFSCTDGICPDGFECVAEVCVPPGSAPDAAPTAFERQLTVDHAVGAGPLVDFPLMIRLDASRIEYEVCQPDGGDVRFFDAGGAELPREIERWDPAGVSIIWIRVPAIEPTAIGATLTMRYGDGVAKADAPETIWAQHHAVYHLAGATDSSPSGFDGVVMDAVEVAGIAGPALRFTGAGEHVDLGMDRAFLQAQPEATTTSWVRLEPGWNAPGVVFGSSVDNMGMPTNASRLQTLIRDDRTVEGDARSLEGGGIIAIQGPLIPEDTWTHIAHLVDFANDRMELYVDGQLVESGEALGLLATSADSVSTQTVIGRGEIEGVDLFVGDIDEVRLSHRLESPDVIAAEFRSTGDQMVSFGELVPIP